MKNRKQIVKAHAKALLKAQRSFLEDLISLRRERGLTQDRLADIMGVTQGAVAQFERYDANPTLGTIRRYALAVGADLAFEVRPKPDYRTEVSVPVAQETHQVRRAKPSESTIRWDQKKMFENA